MTSGISRTVQCLIVYFLILVGSIADAASTNVCGQVREASTANIVCPAGYTVTGVSFASYGAKPSGSCGSYVVNRNCNSSISLSVMRSLCLNKASCRINALNSLFGDPCVAQAKWLTYDVKCSNVAVTPTPAPVPTATPTPVATATPMPTPTPTPAPAATVPPVAGNAEMRVDLEDMEFVGPFASWLNVKSLGAVGNGVADDTAAIQKGLNQVAHTAGGPVILYFPAGTYRITSTLNYNGTNTNVGNGMGMIGEHPSTTSIMWDGPAGGNMIVVNGGFGHRFERLTWDGKSKANIGLALWWDASTNANYGGSSAHTDEVFKDMKIGIMAGRLGANYGQLDSEGRVRRVKFLRMSQAGITTGSWNALDWWIYDSEFTDCAIGVTNIYTVGESLSAGNFLIYRSLFQRSTQADFWIANGGWFSAHNNVSIGSKRFYHGQLAGPSGAQVTLQNNRIVDSTDPSPIYLGNMGPVILIDNQIRSLASSIGPVVKMDNSYPSEVISIGNAYTINSTIMKKNSADRVLSIGDKVVSSGTISAALPAMPGVAVNKNRQVFEVGSNVNASTIQAAINSAINSGAENPVVHINPGMYNINSTLTIPAGRRVQLVGDSIASFLGWSGGAGATMISLPGPSLATLRDLTMRNGGGTVITMTNADQAGGRIFGANSTFAKVSIANLAQTRASFQSNSSFVGLDIAGTKSFISVGSGNAFPVNMSGASNVVLYDAWYEGAEGKLWGGPDGNFTLNGGNLAPSNSVHGGTSTEPSFYVNNFSGKISLIGLNFDLQRVDNGIVVGAENANTNALVLGVNANQSGYFKRSSSGGNAGILNSQLSNQSTGTSQLANYGSGDANFVLNNLEQSRSVFWDSAPAVIPAGATDVRFYNVEMLNSIKSLAISK